MVQGVIEDQVPVGGHAPDKVGVGLGPHAGDAEAGNDVFLLEAVQDVLGVASVGARIEGQRHR